MTTEMTTVAGATTSLPMPGLRSPGLNTAVVPHYAAPQPVRKFELDPLPASSVHYDRNALEKSLQDAIKLLNDQMSSKAQGLGFSYDNSTNSPVVTVRNLASGEVLKQIPSADLLRLAHRMDDLKGILYNAKA